MQNVIIALVIKSDITLESNKKYSLINAQSSTNGN